MKNQYRWLLLALCFQTPPLIAEEEAATQPATEEVQEIKYVTDKLRLSLYGNSKGGGGTLKLLSSGDKLEVLEKSGNYARVRTDDGSKGWVKAGFLVSDPTSNLMLIEEQNKNSILAEKIEQFSDTEKLVGDYENTIELMQQDQQQLTEQLQQAQQQHSELAQDHEALTAEIAEMQQGEITLDDFVRLLQSYWYLALLLLLVTLGLGFLLGKSVVESQLRQRFHGVKVW